MVANSTAKVAVFDLIVFDLILFDHVPVFCCLISYQYRGKGAGSDLDRQRLYLQDGNMMSPDRKDAETGSDGCFHLLFEAPFASV